jgi:hypothetical protein
MMRFDRFTERAQEAAQRAAETRNRFTVSQLRGAKRRSNPQPNFVIFKDRLSL